VASTVLLAEDHEVLRQGLRQLIEPEGEFEVVAEAADGRAAVELAHKHRPDVVVMDIWMPRLSGIDATRQILEQSDAKVLILSQHDSWSYVEQALRAGASGYVVKTSSASELLSGIRAVSEGKSYLSPDIAQQLVGAFSKPEDERGSPLQALTNREREVLQLIAECLSSKEIAVQLGVSVRTVEAHRASLMEKLDIHKLSGLVRFAIREGLVAP